MSRKPTETPDESPPRDAADPATVRLVGACAGGPDGRPATPALSLDLPAGSAHVITGPPGCGKTAILEMIGLARTPARGRFELFGTDVSALRPPVRFKLRRRIGMIFQDGRLIGELSARDNVALAAKAAGRRASDYDEPVGEVLGWVGLSRRADSAVSTLDDEGRRRLAVARAVINGPDLLIADEPSGEAILKLLSDLNRAGTTMLIATRDADLAERSGAEVTRIGALQEAGSPGAGA